MSRTTMETSCSRMGKHRIWKQRFDKLFYSENQKEQPHEIAVTEDHHTVFQYELRKGKACGPDELTIWDQ